MIRFNQEKQTKTEDAKRNSRYLRGEIAETLASDKTHFEHDDEQVLKFHGVYEHDDRDTRKTRRAEGLEADYMFMVRITLPGGVMTADQYLAIDRLADEHGNGSLRVTTRQGLQFHGVRMNNLKNNIAAINETLITTLGACGDVQRNVMTCPAPIDDEPHRAVRQVAADLAAALRPESRAYHEIWLGAEKVASTKDEEGFYGEQYLPRKFKTAIALDSDNCVDVFACDCGLIAITEQGRVLGYQVIVGGGLGMTHEKASTFARLGDALGFVAPEHAVDAARVVAAIFRDHGNRSDRKHARLKYLIEAWGLDEFRRVFEEEADFELRPPRELGPIAFNDHLGHQTTCTRDYYGVYVENGRIIDRDGLRLRSALREIIERYRPGVRLTAQQNLLLTDLEPADVADIERRLQAAGVTLPSDLTAARRYSLACPALPTCSLAITESERVMPSVLGELEAEIVRLGVAQEPLTVRMTGCPNGCARPYTADIAFVGRKPGGSYNIYVGGSLGGDRVADCYAADVPVAELVATLKPLLRLWVERREDGEGFSDFYRRWHGTDTERRVITGAETPTISLVSLPVLA
jgi:sulfite reductase (ferredoxin)